MEPITGIGKRLRRSCLPRAVSLGCRRRFYMQKLQNFLDDPLHQVSGKHRDSRKCYCSLLPIRPKSLRNPHFLAPNLDKKNRSDRIALHCCTHTTPIAVAQTHVLLRNARLARVLLAAVTVPMLQAPIYRGAAIVDALRARRDSDRLPWRVQTSPKHQ